MQEINETLSETNEYTITCGINKCFHCAIVMPVSECKLCKNPVCNECREDHLHEEHNDIADVNK